ncbi:Na+/H+ antiporter NhaC [Oscillibacter sp. GMB15532]|uniref:Na+/H+ antiporter NhaC n=1 Tax=Oscillibacter sp. GMB15532 TaxID=3230022 RepID=UPI0034DF84BC
MEEAKTLFRPKLWVALASMVFLIAAMCCAIFLTGQQLHITMMTCLGFTILLLVLTGCPYATIEEAILHGGKLLIPTLVILYCIGGLMGSWIASGTVPMVIYWGLKLISPKIFLTTACLACVLTSMATGSSWSTAGTVGVALMGVGMGLGVNPAWTAGAVVSGAAFGDKMSPMSDTTNVAPAVAEADLFDHIKAMCYTGGPAIVLALIGFTIMGFSTSGSVNNETVSQILSSLDSMFKMNFIELLPIIIVLALAFKRFPAFPTLLISGLVAAAIAVLHQGVSISSIMSIMESGFVCETGIYDIDKLLSRGGMFSMNYTASLSVIVMVFGGVIEKCGILDVLLEKIKGLTKTVGTLVLTTVLVEIALNLVTASQYMTLILGGKLLMPAYREKDMLPQCLSRTLEDSGTVTSPLIPWNLCGAFIGAALGVNAFTYLPFALFCWICPLVAILWGFMGKFQWKTGEIPSKRTYRPVEEAVVSEKQ